MEHKLIIKEKDEHLKKEVLEYIKDDSVGLGSIDFNKITPIPKWAYVYCEVLDKQRKIMWGIEENATHYSFEDKNTINFVTFCKGDIKELLRNFSLLFPDVLFEYIYTIKNIKNTVLIKDHEYIYSDEERLY